MDGVFFGGEKMTEKERLRVQLEDSLTLQQSIRLFAMANLSEDNPFRPAIEEQTCRSVTEIKEALEQLENSVR